MAKAKPFEMYMLKIKNYHAVSRMKRRVKFKFPHNYSRKNVGKGASATFIGKPSEEMFNAVKSMVEIAKNHY